MTGIGVISHMSSPQLSVSRIFFYHGQGEILEAPTGSLGNKCFIGQSHPQAAGKQYEHLPWIFIRNPGAELINSIFNSVRSNVFRLSEMAVHFLLSL